MLNLDLPIQRDDESPSVRYLHQILAALELPVDASEVEESKAGVDTQEKVQYLLNALKIDNVDDQIILDHIPALAIERYLKERGFLAGPRRFSVSGKVMLANGKPARRQLVAAYDLDFFGVERYNSVGEREELDRREGFDYLGQTFTDAQGRYRIEFYDWQYQKAERFKADIMVFALNGQEVMANSRLVSAADYADKGVVRDIDLQLRQNQQVTEYAILTEQIQRFLKESNANLDRVARNQELINFTASELGVDVQQLQLLLTSNQMENSVNRSLNIEMLYGLGRDGVQLEWPSIFKRRAENLQKSIESAIQKHVIQPFADQDITAFISALLQSAAEQLLGDADDEEQMTDLRRTLSLALPEEDQKREFLAAVNSFSGNDFKLFWNEHLPSQPAFLDKPELVNAVLFNQQLANLTLHYTPLIQALQGERELTTPKQLVALTESDWLAIIERVGVPEGFQRDSELNLNVTGNGEAEVDPQKQFVEHIRSGLYRTFPNLQLSLILEDGGLSGIDTRVQSTLAQFLSDTTEFKIDSTPLGENGTPEVDSALQQIAGDDFAIAKDELRKLQRVKQLALRPELIAPLLNNDLTSAYNICQWPEKSFKQRYAGALGGEAQAEEIYKSAAAKSMTSERIMMRIRDELQPTTSFREGILDDNESARQTIAEQVGSSYVELFGAHSFCECSHCRSVFGPAAYLVDILRFLSRTLVSTSPDVSALDLLKRRRPDIVNLPLTCENSNTLIPYVDLANEVMEAVVVADNPTGIEAFDTGDTSSAELQASPQNIREAAYRIISDNDDRTPARRAIFPFSLPYHRPLDGIRTYCEQLGTSRYELMSSTNPLPSEAELKALQAESLSMTPEEYALLCDQTIDGVSSPTAVETLYGFDSASELESQLPAALILMQRTGVSYVELVDLLKTHFINPQQMALEFLDTLFAHGDLNPAQRYEKLGLIADGRVISADDPDLPSIINGYSTSLAHSSLTPAQFDSWVMENFTAIRDIVVLNNNVDACDLEHTRLSNFARIYEPGTAPGLAASSPVWRNLHDFIRLWRKLDWSISELDCVLNALAITSIDAEALAKLHPVLELIWASGIKPKEAAVLWGNIELRGKASQYRSLFLNRAMQPLDIAFLPDAQGGYFSDSTRTLEEHQATIMAAFWLKDGEFADALSVAMVDDGTAQSGLQPSDGLTLEHLSLIYRHVVLAKSLNVDVSDLSQLIELYRQAGNVHPFSVWERSTATASGRYIQIDPSATLAFYQFAQSVYSAKFSAKQLAYTIDGLSSDSVGFGLDEQAVQLTVHNLRTDISKLSQSVPIELPPNLSSTDLAALLNKVYPIEETQRLLQLLEGTSSDVVVAPPGLAIDLPSDIADKYSYSNTSGVLAVTGIVSEIEATQLKALSTNANFHSAVDHLFEAPVVYLRDVFAALFPGPAEFAQASQVLLDRPVQPIPATLDTKLAFVYRAFVPRLLAKLRQDLLLTRLAELADMEEKSIRVLLKGDMDALADQLMEGGFSATYFSDREWRDDPANRIDKNIDFHWVNEEPLPGLPVSDFSARWEAFVVPAASGEYRLIISVEQVSDAFRCILDGETILLKQSGDTAVEQLAVFSLTANQFYDLRLEFAAGSNNSGIRLSWQNPLGVREVIPSHQVYPMSLWLEIIETTQRLHRAALWINGMSIDDQELQHFTRYAPNFSEIDFGSLTLEHWRRLNDYSVLRKSLPQREVILIELFRVANNTAPTSSVSTELLALLGAVSGWRESDVNFLAAHFRISDSSLLNEVVLLRLQQVMKLATRFGVSAKVITELGSSQGNYEALSQIFNQLSTLLKSNYSQEDWLAIAEKLNDRLRVRQQAALVSYLLQQPRVRSDLDRLNIKPDADGCFEYLLIDVQMSACMDTSRIVQASATVQQFMNRALLNLEPEFPSHFIDQKRWEWMSLYRVWEANRKIFVYKENWLAPEWRFDRSEFFKNLESYLAQNDINPSSVEEALRGYVTSLNEVANLEICGMHREDTGRGVLRYRLHVFGRTRHAPYKYFYRIWNEYQKWSAWESVPVDVKPVIGDVSDGVHLIPVIFKGRLVIFWPEFSEILEENNGGSDEDFHDLANKRPGDIKPTRRTGIKFAWSEYDKGSWTAKNLSKEFSLKKHLQDKSRVSFKAYQLGDRLKIAISESVGEQTSLMVDLEMTNIESNHKITVYDGGDGLTSMLPKYDYHYQSVKSIQNGGAHLAFEGINYLNSRKNFRISGNASVGRVRVCFFYSENNNTYFVVPRKIPVQENILEVGVETKVDTTQRQDSFDDDRRNSKTNGDNPAIQLEFHTFHHPYAATYLEELNEKGVEGLLSSDTTLPAEVFVRGKPFFVSEYGPEIDSGLVRESSGQFENRTFYKHNVCFDIFGSNSLCNWELFYHVPVFIAIRLSRNGQYEEAMNWFHYIFNPRAEGLLGEDERQRVWKVLPFKTANITSIEAFFKSLRPNNDPISEEHPVISEWRDNPFDPHLVAGNDISSYMKYVVIEYIKNLKAWGDAKFRQFTRESVYEALQLYVMAKHLLGKRPHIIPQRANLKAETYKSIEPRLDDFGNALVAIENLFPNAGSSNVNDSSTSGLLGAAQALYFCVPPNNELLELWDCVDDRLFKIRHCKDIDGVERQLALFAPPIDPALLLQARAQGLSLGSILSGLGSPPPIYRFNFLLQKANEFCNDVKGLGAALLSTLEKRDAEQLARIRASQESTLLELMSKIRERQVLEAEINLQALLTSRETAQFRLNHYTELLGNELVDVPEEPEVEAELLADSQLPAATNIQQFETDIDDALEEGGDSGLKLISREREDLTKREIAKWIASSASALEIVASLSHLAPEIAVDEKPFGVGFGSWWGGQNLGFEATALARAASGAASFLQQEAAMASTLAGYIRREQDWTLQANLACAEITQIDKQIIAAKIRKQISEQELLNHRQQIEHSQQVEEFLHNKFTNQELYQWQKEQLLSLHKQSFNVLFEMAKRAEKAYQFEMGDLSASFINYGYWNDSMHGLHAGDKLQLALREMESAWIEKNRRHLELRKTVSMALLDPLALLQLRETGKCQFSMPEEIFDLDFQTHYFRRLKSVSLSIPCVAGPNTSVSCSLRLLKHITRIKTNLLEGDQYPHKNDEGIPLDDDRFYSNIIPVTSVAISSGQNDAGLFEFSFRDERYLPFEGAGVISTWEVQLTEHKDLRQFDYTTITDCHFHLSYNSREQAGLKGAVTEHLRQQLAPEGSLTLFAQFDLNRDFPSEWHRYWQTLEPGVEQVMSLTLGNKRFPYIAQNRQIRVSKLSLFAKVRAGEDPATAYDMAISYFDTRGNPVETQQSESGNFPRLNVSAQYGDLLQLTININEWGLALEDMDINAPISVKLKRSDQSDFDALQIDPPEFENLYLNLAYSLV